MAGTERKYIEAAYESLARDGIKGVSIRKVADEVGCSSSKAVRVLPSRLISRQAVFSATLAIVRRVAYRYIPVMFVPTAKGVSKATA